jgi:hypothetical protein
VGQFIRESFQNTPDFPQVSRDNGPRVEGERVRQAGEVGKGMQAELNKMTTECP